MLTQAEFSKRRRRLLDHLGFDAIAVLFSAAECLRNGDSHYPFRQNSDFLYLTGFNEPNAVAVFVPGRQAGEYILFNRPHDPQREIWDGNRAGQEGACRDFGADQAFDINLLADALPELCQGKTQLHYLMDQIPLHDQRIHSILEKITSKASYEKVNLAAYLSEQRLVKSQAEIAAMRHAAEISATAHAKAMQICRPNLFEYHLEAALIAEFMGNGCHSVAYNSIVGAGANSCTLHYNDNNAALVAGELVLIDAGCEYQGYAADITRTFPVNGRFSSAQKAIYEAVLQAQLAAIEQIKPGVAWPVMQETIITILTQQLLQLGILKGKLQQLIASKAYLPFYMHNSGHWLGLDVHDVGGYKQPNGQWKELQPGMVLTVEPGLYIRAAENIDKCWWNIGVRIEDDVVVTEDGYDILSKGVPKTIAEIETLMANHGY